MMAPLALLVLAAAPGAEVPALEACDPALLARVEHTPRARAAETLADLDRRIQVALAAERGHEESRKGRAVTRERAVGLGALAACLAGAVLVGVGGWRRRRALMLAGGLLVAGGAALPVMPGVRANDAETALLLARCRLALVEARAVVKHAQLAACVHDLSEIDEELVGLEGAVRAGRPVTLPELGKLRGELHGH